MPSNERSPSLPSVALALALGVWACGGRTSLPVGRGRAAGGVATSTGAGGAGAGGSGGETTSAGGAMGQGGEAPACEDVVLGYDGGGAHYVALSDDAAYWTTGGGHVMRAPLDGGPAIAVAETVSDAGPIALANGFVVWAEPARIRRAPIAGGPVETLAEGQQNPVALAAQGDDLYWLDYGAGIFGGDLMHRAPDGTLEKLVSGIDVPTAMRIDATHAYFTAEGLQVPDGTAYSLVARVPLHGGALEFIGAGLHQPAWLALDDQRVYWLEQLDASMNENGVLYARNKAGGDPVALGTIPGELVLGLSVDETNAYITALAGPSKGRLHRLPLAGGAPSTLAELSGVVYGDVEVAPHAVVWTANWNEAPAGTPSVRKLCE